MLSRPGETPRPRAMSLVDHHRGASRRVAPCFPPLAGGVDSDRLRLRATAFLDSFSLFIRARARGHPAKPCLYWLCGVLMELMNSAFFRAISAFFRVSLPFSGRYPQSAEKQTWQKMFFLPRFALGRKTRRLAECQARPCRRVKQRTTTQQT